jgi:hypothetical protein
MKRHLISRPFIAGLLLAVAGIAATPFFITLGEGACSAPHPTDPAAPSSWDCFQPYRFDARIPMLLAGSGLALMAFAFVRTHRAGPK